jgi:hypothetical protein
MDKNMLSGRLVKMIEDHAEQLTKGLIDELKQNPKTSEYHRFLRQSCLLHRSRLRGGGAFARFRAGRRVSFAAAEPRTAKAMFP